MSKIKVTMCFILNVSNSIRSTIDHTRVPTFKIYFIPVYCKIPHEIFNKTNTLLSRDRSEGFFFVLVSASIHNFYLKSFRTTLRLLGFG